MIKPRARLRWLAVVMLTAACSGSAGLSGDVFVAKSGEIRRGADVDVILVPANGAFEAEWNQVVQGFKDQRARVLAAAQEAESGQPALRSVRSVACCTAGPSSTGTNQ